jgi:hypothetical protein
VIGGLPIEESFHVQLLEKNNWGFFSKTLLAKDFTDAIKTAISKHLKQLVQNASRPVRAYVTSKTKTEEFFLKYDTNGKIAWQESLQNNNELSL